MARVCRMDEAARPGHSEPAAEPGVEGFSPDSRSRIPFSTADRWKSVAVTYILLLADEKFDFDLSLSSSSANEDDEVFLGPVGHKERCIAASLELNHHIPEEPPLPASESHFTWSPLTGEKFVEVYKEAHLLALQIQSNGKTRAAPASKPEDPGSQGVDGFIQESKLKINLFERENEVKKSPKSLKRETYHLSDSPSRGPPPWGTQLPSGAALPAAPAQASRPRTPGPPRASCSSLPVEPSAAHPPDQAGAHKKVTSKLLPPRASSLRGKSIPSALQKPMKEKPASPSRMKILNEKDSHSSVPPDKPRAARDVASLPAGGNHVVQGKRSLPVPNKSGLKKTMLKPPGCASSLARKSSSGSVSGVSASVCASPAAGKAKPRERPSIPADSFQSNTSQLGRTGLVLPRLCLQPGPAGVSCRQSQRPGVAESTAEQPRAPTRAALTQPQTPGQGDPGLNSHLSLSQSSQMNKTGSTRRRDSRLNSKTKVMPSPTNHFKIPKCSTGKVAHSTPARWSSASQSLASSVRTPVSMGRRSALPTPAGRRLSSLPLATPKTMPRALASPLRVSARRLSSEPQKKSAVRTAPVREGDSRAAAGPSDWSPDGSFPAAKHLTEKEQKRSCRCVRFQPLWRWVAALLTPEPFAGQETGLCPNPAPNCPRARGPVSFPPTRELTLPAPVGSSCFSSHKWGLGAFLISLKTLKTIPVLKKMTCLIIIHV
eukprot:bmy_04225T0